MAVGVLREQSRPAQSAQWWGARLRTWLKQSHHQQSHHQHADHQRGEDDRRADALRRLDEVVTVLERARRTLADGWVQDRWYVRSSRPTVAQSGLFGLFGAGDVPPDEVAGACVIGAVALALRERDAAAELTVDGGPAIDFVWDALQESRGLGGSGVAGRATPRDVRLARIRDVARWNDQPERNREDVLTLLDLAVARVIMAAMREPERV
jgi:hypothetical protein